MYVPSSVPSGIFQVTVAVDSEDNMWGLCQWNLVLMSSSVYTCQHNNIHHQNALWPGLGACAASLSSPGRLVLSDLIGAGNRQMDLSTLI